jgi:hypothetical protein
MSEGVSSRTQAHGFDRRALSQPGLPSRYNCPDNIITGPDSHGLVSVIRWHTDNRGSTHKRPSPDMGDSPANSLVPDASRTSLVTQMIREANRGLC